MKKRILAGFLSLVMILSMLPAALAAEGFTSDGETPQDEVVCVCETRCTEEAVNTDCPVCGGAAGYGACAYTADAEETPAQPTEHPVNVPEQRDGTYPVSTATEFADAISSIAQSDETEATIALTDAMELPDDTLGVAGKHITITSETAPVLLTLPGNTLRLGGDVTFKNIYISADTLYAEGNALTLGNGFGGGDDGQTRMTVYGGSDHDLTANTSVTVEDGVYKLISGGNSAGTLTGDTYVEFGGNASFPTAADGAQEGDNVFTKSKNYNLYLKAKGETKWDGPVMAGTDYEYGILPYGIYGGGTCGNTIGNTKVVMTGGTVYQIFGGGAARRNPTHAGQLDELDDLGRVSGSTSVTVTGGEVKSVYGGGYNDIFVFSSYEYDESGVPAEAREQRAVVEGDTYVEISGSAHVPAAEQSEDTSTSGADCPAVYGGSFHSTVYNTEVVISGNAVIESGESSSYGYGAVYGAGSNDVVRGTTSITLTDNAVIGNDKNEPGRSVVSQGKFSMITPMGRSSQSRCYLGGAVFSDLSNILNEDNAEYAAVAEVSGGSVDVLMAGVKSRTGSGQPLKTCNGNVQLKQSGGSVLAIEGGSVYEKNMVIDGDVDVLVTGGATAEYILGRYPTSDLGDSEIKGDCTLTFSNCGSADAFRMSPLIWAMDSVLVTDSAHVAVFGEHPVYDENESALVTIPLYQVNDLTIDEGAALAFRQEANITGNLAVNGALHMARVKKTINIGGIEIPVGDPKAITLTAGGTATGDGQLLPIEAPKSGANYGIYFAPVVNEEYVYAQAANSNLVLTLAQGADQFSVARKNSTTAGQDVWYIAKQAPQEVTVTFDKNGGDTEASPAQITVTSGSAVGTLPTPPARAGHTFQGWNTAADGSGTAFTADTPVTGDITVYAKWQPLEEQLWYYEVYYQFYDPDGTQKDENGATYNWVRQSHGQGGWAYPNDTVSINHGMFDGDELEWDAIDGSGTETLGVHYVYDKNYGPHRLSALCGEATAANPLKIYYRTAPHTVTYQYEGTVPAGAPKVPDVVHTGYSAPVTVAADPALDGYTFSGWTVKSPANVTIENGQLTMPNQDVVLTGSWKRTTTPVDPKIAAYRVEHYQEQLDGSYQLSATEFPLYGEIGATVTAVPKAYEHYHVNDEKSTLTGTVTMPAAGEDGTPEILTLQVYYDLDTVMVSYDLNGGMGKDGVSYEPETVKYGAAVTVKDAPSKSGYTFEGWSDGNKLYHPGDVLTVLGNITLTAQWDENSSGGGGGTTYYTLHYESNGGTEYKNERYPRNTVVELDKAPTREGYTFTGWYADEELTDSITEIKMTSSKTVYAGWEATGVPDWLNGKDHFAYVVGYVDGTVRPLSNISRSEVAAIFFRLLDEDIREENLTSDNTFADVNEGMWYNTAISTMARLGIVKGRSPEHFDPDAPITRAEFAAICARFDTSRRSGSSDFTDISGHWAEAEIERAASLGWIMGHTDGTFRPESCITRAEAMTMINRVLGRLPEDKDDLLDGMNVWPDNQPDAWYYLAVQEATNSHDFTRKDDVHEHWTKLTAGPDWTEYQS